MIIRNKKIIDAQNELNELEKFYKSEITRLDGEYSDDDLLIQTIQKKRKFLVQLYVKQMKIYLNKEGSKEDA